MSAAGIVRAPLDADAERWKRIDRYIDYFGSGGPAPVAPPREVSMILAAPPTSRD
jgi:hypothetical protein